MPHPTAPSGPQLGFRQLSPHEGSAPSSTFEFDLVIYNCGPTAWKAAPALQPWGRCSWLRYFSR